MRFFCAHPVVQDLWLHCRNTWFIATQHGLSLYALEVEAAIGIGAHLRGQLLFAHELDQFAGDYHHARGGMGANREFVWLIREFDLLS